MGKTALYATAACRVTMAAVNDSVRLLFAEEIGALPCCTPGGAYTATGYGVIKRRVSSVIEAGVRL